MRLRFLRSPVASPGLAPPRRSSLPFFLGRGVWLMASRAILPTMLSDRAGRGVSGANTSSAAFSSGVSATGFSTGAGSAGFSAVFSAGLTGFGASALGASTEGLGAGAAAAGFSAFGSAGAFTTGAAGAGAGAFFTGSATGAAGLTSAFSTGAGLAGSAAGAVFAGSGLRTTGLPLASRSILPKMRGWRDVSEVSTSVRAGSLGAGAGAGAAGRTVFCLNSLSGANLLTSRSTISPSTRVLGPSSMLMPFSLRKLYTVGRPTFSSLARVLIFVFAIYCCLLLFFICF